MVSSTSVPIQVPVATSCTKALMMVSRSFIGGGRLTRVPPERLQVGLIHGKYSLRRARLKSSNSGLLGSRRAPHSCYGAESREAGDQAHQENRMIAHRPRVLLVTAPYHSGVVESAGVWMPLNFAYVAGAARKAGA